VINPELQVWQSRSLLYACNSCADAVFTVTYMRRNHPDWILHTATGAEIHPDGDERMVLLDFHNINYLDLWAQRVVSALGKEGWTGVLVDDATNDPDWSGVPVDDTSSSAGQPITPSLQRAYLAQALTFTRAVVKTTGFRLAALNPPPQIVDTFQINSTDSVSTGGGFALLTGDDWTELFDYYYQAFVRRVAPIVWDDQGSLDRSERVYGLASYLLVQTELSVYGARHPLSPLYRLNLGDKNDGTPTQQGTAWTRVYPSGEVAVNPAPATTTVKFTNGPTIDMPPFSAVIIAGSHTVQSW
jgi:hypothetical protein